MRFIQIFAVTLFISVIQARPNQNFDSNLRIKIIRLQDDSNEELLKYAVKDEGAKCGYDSCPKPQKNKLNVHLVPHTHDDVGWLKTVDQYYYGSRSGIQKAGVQYILDSVVQALLNDPAKKFIYVESAFFFKWYDEQTPELQEKVKMLVNEGRLEFIGGAWSMNDEADTHYNSVVDQFTWGLRRLNDTFGECGRPKVGWQIDPFGHSREQASMFAQMGYDGLFFGRLDWQDKQNRLKTQTAEMIWHGSANLGESSDLFTGVLFNNYGPPPGFCWDVLCDDEPINDDRFSPDYNVQQRVDEFFAFVEQQAKHYRTNNIIMTMGGDFTYMDANVYYKNLDKLIRYGNERQKNNSDINLFYSTPSCYLKALYESELTWPEKSDDFFPYSSDPHAFWTGYFTSRPTVKRFERVGNHFLQVCKQLSSFSPVPADHYDAHLTALREAMGVMQHHDAITGTEKQKVAFDYARILYRGMQACNANVKTALNQLTTKDTDKTKKSEFSFSSCTRLNVSMCDVTETTEKFIVTAYNPLAHSVFEYIRVPVQGDNYLVQDYRNVEIKHQVVSVPDAVKRLDFRESNSTYELVFLAPELPPLGYKSFFVTRLKNKDSNASETKEQVQLKDSFPSTSEEGRVTIGNKYLNLSFGEDGFLESVTTEGVTHNLTQYFVWYQGAVGNNMEYLNRSSGAYIFRPNNTEQLVSKKAELQVVRGLHVEEVRQVFNDWVSQVVRVYREENFVEFEWMIGGIPTDDGLGKEVVSRFYSSVQSNGTFFTDSNGREMLRRERNHRDTWKVMLEEKIAGNYYPVTTRLAIEDEETRFAMLTDRAQGGTSLFDGSLELMVHRRLLHDDAFGVAEALNEKGVDGKGLVARGKHWLVIGKKSTPSPTIYARERFLQNQKLLPNWLFFSDASKFEYGDWMKSYSNIYSALSVSLPMNIHLLTFEPWRRDKLNGDSYLLRFEHLLEKDEDPEYSKPVTFNLQDVFRGFDIAELKETTLAGNQWLADAKRFKFTPDPKEIRFDNVNQRYDYRINPYQKATSDNEVDPERDTEELSFRKYGLDYEITLKPMQIRTFVMQMNPELYDH
ncbi:lysosomal alpha-mannosidase-like isoform X2 [Culicoides brevitarsis]|uniref:lysosomal alpha-mannosidase-like isoform X2 n=1 Tax=Culicoides brevitarsis TaxID=469753 RepID=UPI00307B577D